MKEICILFTIIALCSCAGPSLQINNSAKKSFLTYLEEHSQQVKYEGQGNDAIYEVNGFDLNRIGPDLTLISNGDEIKIKKLNNENYNVIINNETVAIIYVIKFPKDSKIILKWVVV